MAIEIVVPRLGWSMEEGLFTEWLKREGEVVNAGDMLFVIEGDKAAQEIESFDSGILRIAPNAPQPGEAVTVGRLLGYLVEEGESAPFAGEPGSPVPPAQPAEAATEASAAAGRAGPATRRLARETGVDVSQVQGSGPSGRILAEDIQGAADDLSDDGSKRLRISPRARRVAVELGIDWTGIRGTGKTGRIRERDIRTAAGSTNGRTSPRPSPGAGKWSGRTVPITNVRKTIARRMMAGVHSTAPVTLTTKADATNLVNVRRQFKAAARVADEPVPGYTDLIVKLVSVALQQHPLLAAQWTDGGIVIPERIDIAFAVDTEAGLMAPVLRDVASLTLREVAAQARDLRERAGKRRLTAEEMQGAGFTVTNLGGHGIDSFTPIISPPQSSVLGVGRVVREPVVIGDEIAAGETMWLSLTFDHRVVDGAPAAGFLDSFRGYLEQPSPWLMP